MTGMFSNTLNADIFIVSFAIKFIRLVMEGTKLMVPSNLLLVTSQLQDYKIFTQHIRFDLRVMFKSTCRAV